MSDHDASASGGDTKREEGEAATSAGEGQVVVVTGGNKGIGFEVCRQVAVEWPTADVILASRDQDRAEAAVATLKADGVSNVRFLATLDVASAESVAAFAAALAAAVSRVDVLVNNAGVFVGKIVGDPVDRPTAEKAVNVNLRGTMAVTRALLPLLRTSPQGRIVNVATQAAKLSAVDELVQAKLLDETATTDAVASLADSYLETLERGVMSGWSDQMYAISKLLLLAYSDALARQFSAAKEVVTVNCVCPGMCGTDMTHYSFPRTAAEGAEGVVYLCVSPDVANVSGGYYYEKKAISWRK